MKKVNVIWVVLCFVLLCSAAAPPKFWAGLLRGPTAEWAGAYGTANESWLAYNTWVNIQLLDGQGAVIAAMKKELAELRAVVEALTDPNEYHTLFLNEVKE